MPLLKKIGIRAKQMNFQRLPSRGSSVWSPVPSVLDIEQHAPLRQGQSLVRTLECQLRPTACYFVS